ncbi:MAG: zinc-dependent metalloprotease [Terrimesophilobacter sp.]
MPDNSDRDADNFGELDPEDEMRDMLRDFLAGNSDIDPEKLAGFAGLGNDPALVARLMSQLQNALKSNDEGINWDISLEQAKNVADKDRVPSLPAERSALEQSFHVAALWLDEATFVSELSSSPKLVSRTEWVSATMPIWTQLAEPVATSIADALTRVIQEQASDDMSQMMSGASKLMRNVGGALFAMQLGQVVGHLSTEVVSGGDVGIPLLGSESSAGGAEADLQAVIIPQNLVAFGKGIDVDPDQVQLYLAVRELAHARLFRHARWLRLQMLTAIKEISQGLTIDTGRLQELAESFDPSNPESLQQAMSAGELLAPKTDQQNAALARLETTLALIEGWVDVVTAEATKRLPKSQAIAETVRRRRASGGPAESAFATLIGLELRPRRLREAAALWQQLTDEVGAERRDSLWSHPDLVPTGDDIDDPTILIAKLSNPEPELDDIDRAIEDLLNDDSDDRPTEE